MPGSPTNALHTREVHPMAEDRMTKTALFTHFADRFGIKRAEAREFFDELQRVSEQELLRCGEFMLPSALVIDRERHDEVAGSVEISSLESWPERRADRSADCNDGRALGAVRRPSMGTERPRRRQIHDVRRIDLVQRAESPADVGSKVQLANGCGFAQPFVAQLPVVEEDTRLG